MFIADQMVFGLEYQERVQEAKKRLAEIYGVENGQEAWAAAGMLRQITADLNQLEDEWALHGPASDRARMLPVVERVRLLIAAYRALAPAVRHLAGRETEDRLLRGDRLTVGDLYEAARETLGDALASATETRKTT